jgi:hypothetical protein
MIIRTHTFRKGHWFKYIHWHRLGMGMGINSVAQRISVVKVLNYATRLCIFGNQVP